MYSDQQRPKPQLDYPEPTPSGYVTITALGIVAFAVLYISLAKLGVLPDWLVEFTMPRIYS